MPVFFIVEKTTYLNELNPQIQEKFKCLRDMFPGLNVFEAKLNLLHKVSLNKISATLELAKPCQNLPLHSMISRG